MASTRRFWLGPPSPSREAPASVVPSPSRGLTLLLGALSAFGPLSMDMYLPGLPALSRSLHASASLGQLTLTGCMAGIALGQVLAGPMSDATGRRIPLLVALLGYLTSSLACAFAPSIAILIALRLAQGMAGGAGLVIARAVVRDVFEGARAARVYSLLVAIMGVAPVFAPLLGGQILSFTSWRGIFIGLAIIGIGLLVATALWLPETLFADARHRGSLRLTVGVFGTLLRDRSYVPYLAAFCLAAGAMFAYIAGASFVLEDVYGISPQLFSLSFAINSAGLVLLAYLSGRVVGRLGAPYLLRCGLTGAAASGAATLIVTISHAPLAALLVCLLVLLSSLGLVFTNGAASAMLSQRASLGSASALLGLGQFGLGAAVAPLVGAGGANDALPMAILIAFGTISALGVDLAFSPRSADHAVA
jgi:DHA1 family bicyclomycin/chloramphenicol resistance-like MFS transporter